MNIYSHKSQKKAVRIIIMGILISLQLSWTEEHETTKLGKRSINFYDEEGATAIRKVHFLSCSTESRGKGVGVFGRNPDRKPLSGGVGNL